MSLGFRDRSNVERVSPDAVKGKIPVLGIFHRDGRDTHSTMSLSKLRYVNVRRTRWPLLTKNVVTVEV